MIFKNYPFGGYMLKNKILSATIFAALTCSGIGFSAHVFAAPNPVSINQNVAGSKITSIKSGEIAYFSYNDNDEDFQYSPTKQVQGFTRYLMGGDAEGRILVQDFFSDSDKKHTEPYWMRDASTLTSFTVEDIDSPFVAYYHNGNVAYSGSVKDGVYIEKYQAFYFNGGVANIYTPMKNNTFKDDYFYKNGKKAASVLYSEDGEKSSSTGWNEQGKKISDAEQVQSIIDAINAEIDITQVK